MSEAVLGTTALTMMHDSWTVDDLDQLPDDGRRYEVIDGSLLMSPRPTLGHQVIARRLVAALNDGMSAKWEAVDVILRSEPSARMVEPDVVVALSGVLAGGDSTLAADDIALAIEVVSPSSVTTDRVTKPAMLAEAGIPAYWRVEQGAGGVTVSLNSLAGSVYKEVDVVRPGETRHVDSPVTCRIAPGELVGPRTS